MRRVWKASLAAAAAASPSPAAADPATDWWEIANKLNMAQQAASMPSPPEVQRASARAALAVFEAVNAIDRRYVSYLGFPAAGEKASQDAAAATAASLVLIHHYPQNKSQLEEGYALAMAQIVDGPEKTAGIAVGGQAAQSVLTLGGIDPDVKQSPHRPSAVPGEWIGASPPTTERYWAPSSHGSSRAPSL